MQHFQLAAMEKGQSGNPGGRPKRPLTGAYLAQLAEIKKGDRQGRTYSQAIADTQIKQALKGNTMAAKEIVDRTEGRARQALDFTIEGPEWFHIQVNC